MALFKKPETTIWRFDSAFRNGKACGTLVDSGREDHSSNRIWVKCRLEGLQPQYDVIHDIPDDGGLVWIDNRVLPGLGKNRVGIIITSGAARGSPIGNHLGFLGGELSEKLSYAKESEEAADAAKQIEVLERREGESAAIDKFIEKHKKLKTAEGSGSPFGRRREGGE